LLCWLAGSALAGCGGAGAGGGTGGAGSGTGGTGGATPGSGGVAGGTGGSGGPAGTGGAAGSGGGLPGSGGAGTGGAVGSGGGGGPASGSGGLPGTGGRAGAAGGAAGTGASGGAGGRGVGTGGTSGGAGGAGGAVTGGSAAKVICAAGATYGNPLTGMGAVTQIGPPAGSTFVFIEGPVWIASLGTLFFSDNAATPAERIFTLMPPALTPVDFMEASGSNGLAVDNDDKLIVADQRNKRITRVDPVTAQTLDIIVPAGNFKPNDLIVRSDNNIYFTDPASGFYRVSPAGVLTGPMKQVSQPNGIELSLDESALFVGDVGSSKQIHKFTVAADGTVDTTSDQVWVTAKNGTVDGMCVDCAGDLYADTSNGVEVYSSTGTYLGTVPTGSSSNCTFGGADRRTLYVASKTFLKTVTLNVPGLPD
jgi:gluconolactonase